MRIILAAVCVLGLAWSGYWLFGSRQVENGISGWLDRQAEAGWVANYADVSTRGFPNRFDTTVQAPELADPATGLAWSAPFLQLLRLSYTPNHVILVWPDQQRLATPLQKIDLTNEMMRASLVFSDASNLQLDRAIVETSALTLTSDAGWTVDLAKGLLATRPGGQVNAVEIALEATDMQIGGTILDRFTKAGLTPGSIDRMQVDATVGFDALWNKAALEDQRPAITAIDLKLMQINWGQLEFWAAGDLIVDSNGVPSGKITIRAQNWREMLQLAVAAGWVPDALEGALETGLGFLASVSGKADSLDAPLNFENGKIAFGPITLGDAPRLVLR